MATAETVERVQKIFDCVGIHGGYITTSTGYERDLYFLIERDNCDYVTANIGHFTEVGNVACYDPMFDLILDKKEGKIKSIEIKKYFAQNIMGIVEIYPNGRVYHNGKPTGACENLVEYFGNFIYEAVEVLSYLHESSTIHKYEKAVFESLIEADRRGCENSHD